MSKVKAPNISQKKSHLIFLLILLLLSYINQRNANNL